MPHPLIERRSGVKATKWIRPENFQFNDGQTCTCPNGKLLTSTGSTYNVGRGLRHKDFKAKIEGCAARKSARSVHAIPSDLPHAKWRISMSARSILTTPATAFVRRLIHHGAGSSMLPAHWQSQTCVCHYQTQKTLEPIQLSRQGEGEHAAAFALPGGQHGKLGPQWLARIRATGPSGKVLRALAQGSTSECVSHIETSKPKASMNSTASLNAHTHGASASVVLFDSLGKQPRNRMPLPLSIARTLSATLAALLTSTLAIADVTEQEAIQAQLASTLASADYALKKCPNLVIDQARIDAVAKRSGKTVAQLKALEEYAEQRDVILGLEKGEQGRLICSLLPLAHGGYGRGIISDK